MGIAHLKSSLAIRATGSHVPHNFSGHCLADRVQDFTYLVFLPEPFDPMELITLVAKLAGLTRSS
jgi:hypothetical protein